MRNKHLNNYNLRKTEDKEERIRHAAEADDEEVCGQEEGGQNGVLLCSPRSQLLRRLTLKTNGARNAFRPNAAVRIVPSLPPRKFII